MLYRVTLVMDVEIDSDNILDVEAEVVPAIEQLQHNNTSIGLAIQYRAEKMINRQPVDGYWVERLI